MAKLNTTQIVIPGFPHHIDLYGHEAEKFTGRWMLGYRSANYGSSCPELQRSEEERSIEGRTEESQGSYHKNIYAIADDCTEEFGMIMGEGLKREPMIKDEFNALAAFLDRGWGRG